MDQRLAIGSKRLSALMVEIYGEDEPLYFAEVLTVFALILVILIFDLLYIRLNLL